MRWLGNSDIIRQILDADPTLHGVLAIRTTLELGDPRTIPALPTGVARYRSFAAFQADIGNKAIDRDYRWVMYDPESWDWTPVNEQADPWTWLPRFGQYAHAHGYRVITAPARDLGNVANSEQPLERGEDLTNWYLRTYLAKAAASHADIVSVQSQAETLRPEVFVSLVGRATRQAKSMNPYVKVFAGVSTRYGTPAQMAAAARSVHVDGYWLNVPDGDVGKACEFLQAMTGGTT